MKVKERISSAQTSKNLGEVNIEEVGDIDIVRACGMVGQSMPVGVALWRLKYAGDAREFGKVVAGLIEMAEKKPWPGEVNVPRVVNRVVRHWLDDVCHACHGRGYEVLEGTPMLSDVACTACGGTGRSRLPEADDAAMWLQETIARLEREVAGAIMRKLNAERDL